MKKIWVTLVAGLLVVMTTPAADNKKKSSGWRIPARSLMKS